MEKEKDNKVNEAISEQQENEVWLVIRDNLKDNMSVYTFLLALNTFVLSGFFYFYKLGYFYALKVDVCYLRIEKEVSLYYVIGLICMSVFLVGINFVMYKLIEYKEWKNMFLYYFMQVIIFVFIIWVISGIKISDFETISQIVIFLVQIMGCMLFIDLYAIIYGIAFHINQKKMYTKKKQSNENEECRENNELNNNDENNNDENKEKQNPIIKVIQSGAIAIIATAVIGGYCFIAGSGKGTSKDDYKVIVENETQYYAVLHETSEEYIVATLLIDGDEVIVDKGRQNVLLKQNTPTRYFSNIQDVKEEIERTYE